MVYQILKKKKNGSNIHQLKPPIVRHIVIKVDNSIANNMLLKTPIRLISLPAKNEKIVEIEYEATLNPFDLSLF